MALAALWNVPTSQDEFDMWGFCHLAHHRDIANRIWQLAGIHLDIFALDPFDPNEPGEWGNQHQVMHNAINQVLGTSGFDLTEPDWKNPASLSGWIQSNGSDHRQWADLLGVG